ncbi:MAG: hypothetical protein ACJAT6_000140 [Akkermansiaceae bacterium]|jgi:hypothetical protein
MAAELKYAGYDFHLHYGKSFHASKAARAKLPELLRYWKN